MEVSLVMFKADGTRRDFPVSKDRVVIGRKNTCDLRIPLSSVSREHCEVRVADDERAVVRDLGSSNGTFVNHERVQEKDLDPGDEIAIGPVVFTVVIDGDPEVIEPIRTIVSGQSGSSMPAGSAAGAEPALPPEVDRDQVDLSEADASDRSGTGTGTRPPADTGSAAPADEADLPIAEILDDDEDAGELDLPEDFDFDIDLDEDDQEPDQGRKATGPAAPEASAAPAPSAEPSQSSEPRSKASGPKAGAAGSGSDATDDEDPIAALEALAELSDDLSDSDELDPLSEDDEEKRSA